MASRVHGTVKISVLAFDLYIGFVDAVALLGRFQMRTAAPVQFGCIRLHPTPDAAGVDEQTAFCQNLGQMHVREWIAQIPTHRQQDHLARILAALEWIDRVIGMDFLPYQSHPTDLRNGTVM